MQYHDVHVNAVVHIEPVLKMLLDKGGAVHSDLRILEIVGSRAPFLQNEVGTVLLFKNTLEFFRFEKFLHIHIFPYSKREGTVAATMSGQVDECVKKERLHKLSQQQSDIRREMLNSIVDSGKSLEVLCETFDGEFNVGHTDNFLEVRIPSNKKISNEFVMVKPFATDGDYIYADIIK